MQHTRTYYRDKDEPMWCCTAAYRTYTCGGIIFGVFGPLLVLLGVVVIMTTDLEVEDRVADYAQAIYNWREKECGEFIRFTQRFLVSVETSDPQRNGPEVLLVSTEDEVRLIGPAMQVYDRLRLYTDREVLRTQEFNPDKPPVVYTVYLTDMHTDSTWKLFQTEIDVMRLEVVHAFNQDDCIRKHGEWHTNGTCFVPKVATDFCLKIGLNDSTWYPNFMFHGYGCGLAGPPDPMQLAKYRTVINTTELIRFNFTTSLRSAGDPLIFASDLTKGTFRFDFSQRLKWMIVLILFSVGGLCTFLFFVTTVICGIHRLCDPDRNKKQPRGNQGSFYGLDQRYVPGSSDSLLSISSRERNPYVSTLTQKRDDWVQNSDVEYAQHQTTEWN